MIAVVCDCCENIILDVEPYYKGFSLKFKYKELKKGWFFDNTWKDAHLCNQCFAKIMSEMHKDTENGGINQ